MLVSMFLISNVGSVQYDNPDLWTTKITEEPVTFSNTTGAVNRSDYWDDLDTPADILFSALGCSSFDITGCGGSIQATAFVGDLVGNADTATTAGFATTAGSAGTANYADESGTTHEFNDGDWSITQDGINLNIVGAGSTLIDASGSYFRAERLWSNLWYDSLGSTNLLYWDGSYLNVIQNMSFADNVKTYYGDSKEAAIYFDGSDLIIDPNNFGAGNTVKLGGDLDMNSNNITTTGNITANLLNVQAEDNGAASDDDAILNLFANNKGEAGLRFFLDNSLLGGFDSGDATSNDIRIGRSTAGGEPIQSDIRINATTGDVTINQNLTVYGNGEFSGTMNKTLNSSTGKVVLGGFYDSGGYWGTACFGTNLSGIGGENTIWCIDNGGDNLRFYNPVTSDVSMRADATGWQVGDKTHIKQVNVSGNVITTGNISAGQINSKHKLYTGNNNARIEIGTGTTIGPLDVPEISGYFNNDGSKIFTIRNGLYLRGADTDPVLYFANSALTGNARIYYDRTNDKINFKNAVEYIFDNLISTTGNIALNSNTGKILLGTDQLAEINGTGTIIKINPDNLGVLGGSVQIGGGDEQINLTMTSPNGNEWCCGVNNAGTFSCSAGAC